MSVPRYARGGDVQQTRVSTARELHRRFGALAWFGAYTGMWWALVDGWRLVEAQDPERLGEQIMSARNRR